MTSALYVICTPRKGPQYRLPDSYATTDAAIQAAEAAITPAIVDIAVWRELDGYFLLVWERNLWAERQAAA